ncbi:hypothetical protein [Mycobacterium sp.]|uniref:hypothetical protein n=1 Tax=Mycobacterium sp. TaxID=1785 RepID=UPI0025F1A467|nr:hypothetical protein [Mycobacterium sp.]
MKSGITSIGQDEVHQQQHQPNPDPARHIGVSSQAAQQDYRVGKQTQHVADAEISGPGDGERDEQRQPEQQETGDDRDHHGPDVVHHKSRPGRG